ncbi:MAG: 50S ribosomal protein L5 [Candidatus Melainabacteria bacterium]|nr:50S ribosomal protein L5 [Candidatus Melainabacteria bacterium]
MKSFKSIYEQDIRQALMQEFGYTNIHQVPRLVKIVINIGLGDGAGNAKTIEAGLSELTSISAQKAVVTRATKSIAGFKVREGQPIGVMVTLRGDRMYDFAAKLIGVALPRIRDFKGLSERSFDGHGNFNIGLRDQLAFPEINYDKVTRVRGMNITIVTSARTDSEAKALLVKLGVPFKKSSHHNQAVAS